MCAHDLGAASASSFQAGVDLLELRRGAISRPGCRLEIFAFKIPTLIPVVIDGSGVLLQGEQDYLGAR